jgi:hypothetical protein
MTLNSQQKSNEISISSNASGRSLKTVKKIVNRKLTQTMKNSLRGTNDPYLKSFHKSSCHASAVNSMASCEREVIEKILQETRHGGITSEIANKHGMFNLNYYRNISSRHPVEGKENREYGDHIWTNESMAEFILKLIESGTPDVLDNRKQSKTNCLILWLYPSKNKNSGHAVNICRDENGKLLLIDTSYYNIREYEKTFKKKGIIYYKDLKAIKYLEHYNQNTFSLITTKKSKYTKRFETHRDRISDFKKVGASEENISLLDYLKILQEYGEKPYNLKEMFNPTIDGIKPLKLVGKNGKLHESWPKYIRKQFNLPLTLSKLSDTDMLSLEDLDEIFNHNQTTPSPSNNSATQTQIQSQTQPSPTNNLERQSQSQTQSQIQSQPSPTNNLERQTQPSPSNNSATQSQTQPQPSPSNNPATQSQTQLSPTNNSSTHSQIQSQTQPSSTRKIKRRRRRQKRSSIFRGRKRKK